MQSVQTADEYAKAHEGKRLGGLAVISWHFLVADTVGENARIYPSELYAPEITRLTDTAGKGRLFGRLDHPPTQGIYGESLAEAMIVTIDDAAIRILDLSFADQMVKIRGIVLDSARGRNMMAAIQAGGRPALSQRGLAIFESLTDAQKDLYKAPPDRRVEIATYLRLVTFDVVADPGFSAGNSPTMENKGMSITNINELRAAHPTLVAQIETEAKSGDAFKTAVAQGIEAAKPGIIKEALAPVEKERDDAKAEAKKLRGTLESVKPILIEAGVAVETISDEAAAKRNAELIQKNAELAAENAKLKASQEAAEKKAQELETKQSEAAALAAVEAKYAKRFADPKFGAADKTFVTNAIKGISESAKAIEAADAAVAQIVAIRGETQGAPNKATETNNANPDAGSGNATGADESEKTTVGTGMRLC